MIKRHAEKTIKELSKMFSCVMVTGARQVGKTTLLTEYGKKYDYISLDDPAIVQEIEESGKLFFDNYSIPLIIDEVQYSPIIFNYIKILCDKLKKKGIIYLSGSQQFKMMKNVSETLTGRVGILNLTSLSMRELKNEQFYDSFVPNKQYFSKVKTKNLKEIDIWKLIYRGTLPELVVNEDFDKEKYYVTYVNTYLERDVRDLTAVQDERTFRRFLVSLAARSGQLLNKADVARDVGISEPTVERWISILNNSNIIYLLYPYYNNHLKRAIKTPKVYFLDTGLASYLTRWNSYETLKNGAVNGNYFETFVVSEIIKSYYNNGIIDPPLYYYRDRNGVEIDLIIEQDGIIYPIEIKKYSNYNINDINKFKILKDTKDYKIGPWSLICMIDHLVNIDDKKFIIPINYI